MKLAADTCQGFQCHSKGEGHWDSICGNLVSVMSLVTVGILMKLVRNMPFPSSIVYICYYSSIKIPTVASEFPGLQSRSLESIYCI